MVNTLVNEDFPSGDLSLTDEPTSGNLSLTEPGIAASVSQDIAQPRALKAHIGLGKDSPGLDVLTTGIANGQEEQLRQDLTQVHKATLRQQKIAALQAMAEQGKDANMAEAKALLGWQPDPDPNTLFEKNFAKQYTTQVTQNEPSTTNDAIAQDATKASEVMNVAQDMITKQESFKKTLEDLEQRQLALREGQASILSEYPVSSFITSTVTPFLSSVNLRNIAAQTNSLLPGNNLEEQITYLWSLPPEQAAQEFSQAITRLEGVSPHDAEVFAHAVLSFSDSERIMGNLQPLIDATIIGGPLYKLARLMKGGIKGNAPLKMSTSNALEAVGDVDKAADIKAVEQAKAKITEATPTIDKGFDPLGQKIDLVDSLPSYYNPKSLATPSNLGSMSRERAARIVGKLEEQNKIIQGTMESIARVSRTTDAELQAGLAKAKLDLENEHRSILDSVLDVRKTGVADFEHIPAEKTQSNVDFLSMNLGKVSKESKNLPVINPDFTVNEIILGKPDATLFKSATEADNYAQRELGLDFKQYTVREGPGTKHYISVIKSIDETSPEVRSVKLETNNKNSESLVNYYLGYVRTPADQVSQFIRNNRLIATTAPTEIHKMIKDLTKPLHDVQIDTSGYNPWKKSWDRLNDVLSYYRDFQDFSISNSRGMFPKSFAQLEKDWKKVTGKLPTDKEQLAFWTAVKINDFDWTLRNYNLHRDLARQGVEHIAFPHPTEAGTYTGPVWGKVLDNDRFPWGNPEDAVLAIHKNGEWSFTTKHSNLMASQEGDQIKKWMLQPNTKITQIANPDDRPLKGILDRNPHFVISEDIQRSPLPVKLVDYNGGGHVIYPGEWYAKQPVIEQGLGGKWYHYGDKTIMNFETKAQADRYVPRIEEFRQKLLRKDTDLDEFVQKYLPKDVEFWTDKFKGINAILSLDDPIMITERNSTVFSTNPRLREHYRTKFGTDIVDYPESSYNLTAGVDKSFLQDRDGPLMSIKGSGSSSTPVYELTKARTLEPLYAMERGIYNAVKGLYLNDVKTASVEQWIKQYWPIIKEDADKIFRNPYYQFYHGKFVPTNTENATLIQSAENARRNLKNFLRSGSTEFGGDVNIIEEKIFNSIYNKGYGVGDSVVNYYAAKDWNLIKHPIDFLRSAGSNLRFGFFNPIQFWVQAMGATNAVALSPVHGMPGAAGAILHYFHALGETTLSEGVSKGVLSTLDKVSSTVGGWRKGMFQESVEAMDRTKFWNVGRETAWRDAITDPMLFPAQQSLFMDKSYMFFNAGDRFNRLVSWHTAFHEWRWANPGTKITDRTIGEILNRADLLGLNMLRESNSALQKGVLGPATQFQSFRMRLAEAMMSSRLTNYEKARAFTAASVMFGIPIAASGYGLGKVLPGGVFDFYEDIHKYALDNDIDISSTWYRALHGGTLDLVGNYLTGANHEFSKRLGPGASPGILSVDTDFPYVHLGEMLTMENGLLPVVMGPSGSLIESIAKKALPFYAGIHSAVRADQDQFSVTHDEILDVARETSTINAAYNGFMAWNYQKYVSKNKQLVQDDMSKTDAVMMALLGTTRSDISTARTMQGIGRDEKQKVDHFGKLAAEEYRKMFNALDEGDFYKADLYLANAKVYMKVYGDLNEIDQLRIFNQAISEDRNLVERVNQKFYDPTKMPPSKMPARLRAHFGIQL